MPDGYAEIFTATRAFASDVAGHSGGVISQRPRASQIAVSSLPPLCYLAAMKKVSVSSIIVAAVLFIAGLTTEAQQPARIPRIGILIPSSASSFSARVEAFRQRLRELGYVEGKNIVIEYRYAEGKLERLPDLAAELVRLKVDVIVTTGPAVLAAKKASATIPIVFGAACRSSRNWACFQPGATRREYHRT